MSNWNQQPGWNQQQQPPASWSNPQGYQQPGYGYAPRTMDASVDAGLRNYMLSIYNYMAVGLLLSAAVAYFIATASVTTDAAAAVARMRNGTMFTALGAFLFTSPFRWVIILSPLAMIFGYSFLQHRMSAGTARVFYFAFTALMGVSLATIFFVYRIGSIAQVFLMTAAMFGAMSLWGYTTKRDLSGMGTFLIMGVFGLIIAGIVNLFLASSALQFAISVLGVLIFAGLTAFDTQRLKESYYDHLEAGELTKAAIDGALSLYLNFINMFQFLLSLFGQRD